MMRNLCHGLWLLAGLAKSSDASASLAWSDQSPMGGGPPAYESSLLYLHRKLVEIESITGNEAEVGDFLVSYLETLDLTVHKQAVRPLSSSSKHDKPSRFNIHAYPGSKPQTRVLLTSHIDTVPPFYPYERRNSGTEIWGRGSVDAKACVAAQTQAFAELYTSNAVGEGDVGLLFVVGEELGGDGMETANELGLESEAVVFGEPTEGKLASGHKGNVMLSVKVQGKAAHSGYPWLGKSAIDALIAALATLEKLKTLNGTEEGGLPRSDKYGATTLNVGKMSGGLAPNIVAESAEAFVTLRLAAGTPKGVFELCRDTMAGAIEELAGNDGPGCKYEIERTSEGYGPIDIDADIDGFEVITVNYGTDVPTLEGKHKRYLYGPGSILVAHSDHEHLKVDELERAVEDYKKIVETLLAR